MTKDAVLRGSVIQTRSGGRIVIQAEEPFGRLAHVAVAVMGCGLDRCIGCGGVERRERHDRTAPDRGLLPPCERHHDADRVGTAEGAQRTGDRLAHQRRLLGLQRVDEGVGGGAASGFAEGERGGLAAVGVVVGVEGRLQALPQRRGRGGMAPGGLGGFTPHGGVRIAERGVEHGGEVVGICTRRRHDSGAAHGAGRIVEGAAPTVTRGGGKSLAQGRLDLGHALTLGPFKELGRSADGVRETALDQGVSMAHMVTFRAADGKQESGLHDDVDEAIAFVEQLRNGGGADDIRLFEVTEIPLEFRAYYKVELAASQGGQAPAAPVPEQAVLITAETADAAPVLAPETVPEIPRMESPADTSFGIFSR